ncbi:MAG TPA: DUF2336 domain-containing protein [Xanthobacteraceae bacterium]|nr:DUF2336 domain-containing protein [Xanthobacteraceae bacterium]
MSATASLIPQLEDVIAHGTRAKRAEMLERITTLFVHGANRYSDEQIALFDEVFVLLIAVIETKAREVLSGRLAPLENAPPKVLRTLARDDDIAIAGPVLKLSKQLAESDLVALAATKSQAHLQAISERPSLGEAVTDILVRRGDRDVARQVAENHGARISETGFVRLVARAASDGVLAEKVGLRPDIPPDMFRELLIKATAVVHERLLAAASPELREEIRRVLDQISGEIGARVGPRDYHTAQRIVLSLMQAGRMNEAVLACFAREHKFEEMVVAVAALSKVPIKIVDRLMAGERPDPILILCKAGDMSWPTVKSIIAACTQANRAASRISAQALDAELANYERLSVSTARRVVRFWQVKQNAQSA